MIFFLARKAGETVGKTIRSARNGYRKARYHSGKRRYGGGRYNSRPYYRRRSNYRGYRR